MKRMFIILVTVFSLVSCTFGDNDIKEDLTDNAEMLLFSPELIGKMHNEALDYIFANVNVRTKNNSIDTVMILNSSMKLCDAYIVEKGGEPCFEDRRISDSFVSEDMRTSLEAWDYNAIYKDVPLHRKQYLERLKTMTPSSQDEAERIAYEILDEVKSDSGLSDEEKTGLLITIETFVCSMDYWWNSEELATKGLFRKFENWFNENSGIIMSDCVWAQQAFFATAASGIPVIWGSATVGGAVLGSLAAVYL